MARTNVIKLTIVLMFAAVGSGCATSPKTLPIPPQISCVFLSSPLSWTAPYGMFHVPWTTTLEKGPYVSERTDAGGTYYRAPPGGLSMTGAAGSQYQGASPPGMPSPMDGGFYIPNDPRKQPRIYYYFTTAEAPVDPAYQAANCSTVEYERSPSGTKLSIYPLAAAGAAGGAVGGVIGRSIAKGSSVSYGQAAGAGAAGGAVGGLIVGMIINSQVGGIYFSPLEIKDVRFTRDLIQLVADKVSLQKIRHEEGPPATPAAISHPGSGN